MPARAAMRARAAVTVVLPTPPLPATMTSRVCEQKRAASTRFLSSEASIRSRLALSTLAIALLVLGASVAAAPAPVSAAAAQSAKGVVDVIEVSGLLDPVVVDFVGDSVDKAERSRSELLVLQLDSPGAVVSTRDLDGLVATLARSSVPIGVWIGPSGSQAAGGARRLVRAAAVSAIAPGSHVGGLSAGQAVARHAVDSIS